MSESITGIQQVGIGVPDVHGAWDWYRSHLNIDVPIFEEAAEANLMLPYTDGKPQQRHAILALSMQGGGGFEIWQYTSRKPQPPEFEINVGDTGIYATKIKSKNIQKTFDKLSVKGCTISDRVEKDPAGNEHFFIKDTFGNIFQIIKGTDWFKETEAMTGGVAGCVIGVSDIENSLVLYRDVLGYDKVIFDHSGVFEDLQDLPGGGERFRRIVLTHSKKRKGAFSELLGTTEIELLQSLDRKPNKIFRDRLWGDLGFIHLCFDVNNMKLLKEELARKSFHFTVDSDQSFDMGEAAGHFSYIEDPDGTLIEFVETHKVPIMKKFGWYMSLKRRDPHKSLPRWMINALGLNRRKD